MPYTPPPSPLIVWVPPFLANAVDRLPAHLLRLPHLQELEGLSLEEFHACLDAWERQLGPEVSKDLPF